MSMDLEPKRDHFCPKQTKDVFLDSLNYIISRRKKASLTFEKVNKNVFEERKRKTDFKRPIN